MPKLGPAFTGGNPGQLASVPRSRPTTDFYSTPKEVTQAIIDNEPRLRQYNGPVWDCCVGKGGILDVFKVNGFDVVGSDMELRTKNSVYPVHEINFLQWEDKEGLGNMIVTNPPYRWAEDFIRTALGIKGMNLVAMLLKSTYWQVQKRYPLWSKYWPSRIYAPTWRPDFEGLGAPVMSVCWNVWDLREPRYPTKYIVVDRPTHV